MNEASELILELLVVMSPIHVVGTSVQCSYSELLICIKSDLVQSKPNLFFLVFAELAHFFRPQIISDFSNQEMSH